MHIAATVWGAATARHATGGVCLALAACGVESFDAPTFHDHVAPILIDRCAGCHRDGGAAPFALVTLDDALAVADAIPPAVRARRMPPWGPDDSGACNHWRDARWLTDGEIATLADWVEGDRAAGEPRDRDLHDPSPLAGVTASISAGAYTPELGDDDRCFVVDPQLASDGFVTAFDVRAGIPELLRYVRLYQLPTPEAEATALELDALSPRPGYACFGNPELAGAILLGAWIPGNGATRFPDDTGLPIAAGRKLVLAMRYHVHERSGVDETTVELVVAPEVATPATLVRAEVQALALPPQQGVVTTVHALALPAGAPPTMRGVFPRMHRLGTSIRLDVAGRCAVDVPRWDPGWHHGYFYRQPVAVAAGATIGITCAHDTSAIGEPVGAGLRAEDEACSADLYMTR